MSTHKNIDAVCVVVLVFTLLLTILFMNGESLGIQAVVDEDQEYHSGVTVFTANDLDGSWDSSSATIITLNGGSARVSGNGAYVYDGDVVIHNAGRYVISGTLEDGSIIVDTYRSAKVWILLDGAEVTCSDDACFIIEQADKVFLTLAEGSENRMTSGESWSEAALADKHGGVIFARDDLTINGSGSLTISGGSKHGIDANDDLVIAGGTISITAPGDGVHVKESIRIREASVTIEAEDDGLVSKGAEADLYIESGALMLTVSDDAIRTAGEITIAGGEMTVSAGSDAIQSDTSVIISGGTILIGSCYEGIEAPAITISGGDTTIYPKDDGLNASNGSSTDPFGGMDFGGMGFGSHDRGDMMQNTPGNGEPPQMPEGMEFPEMPENMQMPDTDSSGGTEDGGLPYIHITGGNLTVINEAAMDADGLDSNGDILISGGTIRVSLVNAGSNSALDYGSESGGVCEITGGNVIACGSYMMAEGFDSTSTQCSILYNVSAGEEAGTTISLEDQEGNILVSYEVPCSFSSVVISTPELKIGETYLLQIGENAEEITLSEVSASFGDVQSSMFFGNMNWGGMQGRENFHGFGGGHRGWQQDDEMPQPPNFDGEKQDWSFMQPPTEEAEQLPVKEE